MKMHSSIPANPPLSVGFIICLTWLTFDLCHAVSLEIHGDATTALSRDLRSYLDEKISEFEDTLQETLMGRHRERRYIAPTGPGRLITSSPISFGH